MRREKLVVNAFNSLFLDPKTRNSWFDWNTIIPVWRRYSETRADGAVALSADPGGQFAVIWRAYVLASVMMQQQLKRK
jgi:hypothetical protein